MPRNTDRMLDFMSAVIIGLLLALCALAYFDVFLNAA